VRNLPRPLPAASASCVAALALAALSSCRGLAPADSVQGINGEGIDIRPLAPVAVTYSEAPYRSVSPYEDWALVFTAQGSQTVALSANGQRFAVSPTSGPKEFVFRVVQASTNPPYQLVVRLPDTTTFVPAASVSGAYDPNSALTPPVEKPRSTRTEPEALLVNVHGFVTEIGIER